MNHKDVLIRTTKTFIASFLAVYVTALSNLLTILQKGDLNALGVAVSALIPAAVAAGITAAWNYYLQYKNLSA